jgi:hypothetical protein
MAFFEWGTTTNYGATTPVQSVGSGSSPVSMAATVSPLLADTNYHYRLVASNAVGIAYGNDEIVAVTSLLYLASGDSWTYALHDLPFAGLLFSQFTSPGMSRCILSIVPGSFSPDGAFRFELLQNSTSGSGPAVTVTPGVPPDNSSIFFPLWLDDLEGAIRLTMLTGSVTISSMTIQQVGFNNGGFSPNYQNTVTTTRNPQPASLGTQFVSSVTISSAVVTFDINAKNLNTAVFVEWGATTNYGAVIGPLSVNFDYFVRRSVTVSNLSPSTSYHFRVVAINSAGTTYGYDLPFASAVTPPRFIRTTRQPGAQVWLQATGSAGINYTLEKTTTWSNWTAVTNLIFSPAGSISVTQNSSGVLPNFYRFRWP